MTFYDDEEPDLPPFIDWEPRIPKEPTPYYLARVLADYLGAHDLAHRARRGHYDDFLAPAGVADGMELHRLVADLRAAQRGLQLSGQTGRAERAGTIVAAVKAGEFDATMEESEAWAQSEEGLAALRLLLGDAEAT